MVGGGVLGYEEGSTTPAPVTIIDFGGLRSRSELRVSGMLVGEDIA